MLPSGIVVSVVHAASHWCAVLAEKLADEWTCQDSGLLCSGVLCN